MPTKYAKMFSAIPVGSRTRFFLTSLLIRHSARATGGRHGPRRQAAAPSLTH